MANKTKIKHGWSEEEINNLELKFLHDAFECRDTLAVDATVNYAKFLSDKIKLNPDNYPVFMLILESGNHWVIDALIGKNKPEEYFKLIQPNSFLVSECFKMLTGWKRSSIYPKSLLVIFLASSLSNFFTESKPSIILPSAVLLLKRAKL